MFSLTCTSCGSNSLIRVRRGEYQCEHCGSRFFTDGQEDVESDEEAEARLMALFAEAAEYEARDDIQEELKILLQGLDIAPDNCRLMLKLGRAYWRLGFAEKAQEYFRKAEKLNPEDPCVYLNFGVLYLTQFQYGRAKPFIEKGLAMIEADPLSASPNDIAVGYGNYALCIGKLGDTKNAARYLSVAKARGYSPESLNNICRQLHLNPDDIRPADEEL